MTNLVTVFAVVTGYLLGSISSSILVGNAMGGIDIRQHGSGNAGATNTLRILGKKAAAFVVIGDALKGVIAILISMLLCKVFSVTSRVPLYAAGLFAVLGHNFPLYFGFKGGKGVLTSVITVIMLDLKLGLIVFIVSILIMAITKYVSLGSCLGAILLVVLSTVMRYNDTYFLILCYVLAFLVIIRHKTNIKRLINGTESKLTSKK